MNDQTTASELLQKLLDERFKAGYAQAVAEIIDAVKALGLMHETGWAATPKPHGQVWQQVSGPPLADHPGDENDAADHQPPHVQRALRYIEQHPGVTAQEARRDLKNRNVLYKMCRLGLVEKRGTQFFPKDAGAHGEDA